MKLFQLIFQAIFKIVGFFLMPKLHRKTSGAEFANRSTISTVLSPRNRGLLLNGDHLRLDEKLSYQNVCITARVGAGKTTRYVIPNVLDRANQNCSIVVNDPKGEVFEATSQSLARKGFRIIVIDPENPERSSQFNPLTEARDDIELEQIAEILVCCGSASNGSKDDFWLQGAIRFVSLFIKCLKNAGKENAAFFNLHNLYYLFQSFGSNGAALDSFMSRYTVNINDPADESLWNEWRGLLTGNEEGIQSFVLNAITALKSLSNQRVAKLTASSDINLEDIRHQKTAIFLITPAQHAEYYSFLTSVFFRSVFNACMRKMPTRNTLPVYILYDEFGHSMLPNFVSTANTIRGYEVSLSIILQSISQLHARYGKDYADSILGGFNTYIAYAGSDPKTCEFFENIMGKVRERQKTKIDANTADYKEYNLMNAGEIRTIGDDEALLVIRNMQPIRLKTLQHFKNRRMAQLVRQGAYTLDHRSQEAPLQKVML